MVDQIFKALSEPVRLRVMVMLNAGELCVCDLTEVLDLPQSTVSRHMSRLKLLGLVTDSRNGRWVHYRLAEAGEDEVRAEIFGLLAKLAAREPYAADVARLRKYKKTKAC